MTEPLFGPGERRQQRSPLVADLGRNENGRTAVICRVSGTFISPRELMDKELVDRAEAIRATITQLRDSL